MKRIASFLALCLSVSCLTACSPQAIQEAIEQQRQESTQQTGGQDTVTPSNESTIEESVEEPSNEGSTTDVADSELTTEDPEVDEPDRSFSTGSTGKIDESITSVYVSDEILDELNSLETDFTKVTWGVIYTPGELDHLVVSCTPYMDGSSCYLIVALTNLYDEDITVSADAVCLGEDDQEIGDFTVFDEAIRPQSTVIHNVYCSDFPSGAIHWNTISLENVYEESAYWEADWAVTTDSDGYYQVDYTLYNENTDIEPDYVWTLALDENGYVRGYAYSYDPTSGREISGTAPFYKNSFDETVTDIAFFANPIVAD